MIRTKCLLAQTYHCHNLTSQCRNVQGAIIPQFKISTQTKYPEISTWLKVTHAKVSMLPICLYQTVSCWNARCINKFRPNSWVFSLIKQKFTGPCGEYSSAIVAWPPTCSWWTWFSCVCGIVFHFTMLSKEELHTRTIQNWISTALSCSLDSAAAKQVKECLKSAHFVSVSLEILINCIILMYVNSAGLRWITGWQGLIGF